MSTETESKPQSERRSNRSLSLRFRRLLIVACFLYLMAMLMLVLLENSMVYPRPDAGNGDWAPLHFDYEDVAFAAADGTHLHGWYFEHPQPRHHILFFHGNAEHVAYLGEEMDALRERYAASVFVFDFRGYGKSGGNPSEDGVLSDGVAAQRWLADRAGVRPNQIVLFGRSLGGGIAVANAATEGAAALVLDRTFHSMVEIAAAMFRWAPVRWLMRNRYPSAERIAKFDGPLLQMHGTADEVIPFASGRKLSEASRSPAKQFLEFEGLMHNDATPEAFYETLDEFLAALPVNE